MTKLIMYESSKIYAIGFYLKEDFIKICTLNKEYITKEIAEEVFKYLIYR